MPIPMATRTIMMLAVILMFLASSHAMSNELEDYGTWNYREGAEHVNVANVRSVTRVLDSWGKRIFNEIKTLLHSQPNTLLPDYSRVSPLSESLNDLFREVSHLQRRITDLNNRLATLEPFLRRHGYHEEDKDATKVPPQSLKAVGTSLAQYPRQHRVRVAGPMNRVARTRRVRLYKDKNGKVKVREIGT
ncbi:uncharacterized protein Hap1MRO34_020422 isoform 1-T2 [Clarias gariepinus]|uniref:uncharacterized protein si:ch211-243a20.3 n=1 Tax=Clarias gariepinus TaxID=13013 RepID=UPI00234CC61D|nr:uncharacterized protein si:ch211-243a20.3 [Clarias gariepinus]XP_053332647.1 uncharacterized protein si:ch211-243a20.3 [Clarias gariepinus]